jgi:hypothetical protein
MKKNFVSLLISGVSGFLCVAGAALGEGVSFEKQVRIPSTADIPAQWLSCSFTTSDNKANGYATITFIRVDQSQFAGRSLSWTSTVNNARIFLPKIPLREMLTSVDFSAIPKPPSDKPVSTYSIVHEGDYTAESNILLDEFSSTPKKNASSGVDQILEFINQVCKI